ncbi:cytochrome P450 [Trametes versicolor FP-101664 SS1]|uniref:cytochrome P450 n=1 Tax=Trametes versicolor (strain FP-101664) TaxID=717944 RepID=UPI000462471C|nr:cytochrome P450 [Trametes versicolor FP-101664 SS1]EIW52300.1 cytochrome P450 [Trametes versicolor FP-101664 SS1]
MTDDTPLLRVAAQASAVALLSISLYRLFFAPLARLPGPALSALTRLPLILVEFTGRRSAWIHALHVKYGPVVRVAPDEVSFATREAAKEIYTSGGSGYDKTSFYRLFEHFDTPNIFSTLDRGTHADVKKRFAERYNKTHIMRPEVSAVVQEHVDAFVEKCAESAGRSVDVYLLLHCFALDGITGHMFHPNGLHSLTNPRDFAMMEELTYPTLIKEQYFRYYFPSLARFLGKTIGFGNLRTDGLSSVRYVLDTVRSAPVSPHTLLDKLRLYESKDADLTLAASECMDHLVAGLDTTGDALCFLMHHLSLPASQPLQDRLRAELHSNPAAALDDLLYLDALVKEGLRVFCPVPMALPRLVPAGGSTIDGVALPGGTIVSCQPYTLHRLDARVFPDADAFVPERWLEPEGAAERNGLFFAFAAGGRGCIGKNFALFEMKLLLRDVYSAYRTRVAPDMTASMEMDDQVVSARPKGQKCLLVFEKV